jgi:hypothetical protein
MEVEKHSDAYLLNFGGEDGRIFGSDVAIAEEATFNLLLLIFMLTGMRFGLQAAMIRAVERTFVYIRANDFGVGSAHSPILIRTVLVELFIQLDALRSQLLLFRCPEEAAAKSLRAELVAELDCLPNLAAGSETYLIVERLRLAERDNQIEFLMGLNAIAAVSSAGVVSVGASGSSGAANSGAGGGGKGKGRKRKDKSPSGAAGSPGAVQRAAGQPVAAQVSASANGPGVGQQQGAGVRPAAAGAGVAAAGAGSPSAAAGRLAVMYCNQFLASSGCQYAANSGGRACRFVHQIPARASPDYALMAARLLAMGVTPSVDFTSAV